METEGSLPCSQEPGTGIKHLKNKVPTLSVQNLTLEFLVF
jgi:hypothetical protein